MAAAVSNMTEQKCQLCFNFDFVKFDDVKTNDSKQQFADQVLHKCHIRCQKDNK